MINHGERCTHCGGNLSDARPVTMGPRKGQMQRICSKCGHIKYEACAAQPAMQPQQQQPMGRNDGMANTGHVPYAY